MKRTLLLFMFLFINLGFSQDQSVTFEVLKVGNRYPKDLIQKAFSTADLCGNYFISKNHDIVFDDGTIVRLYSKSKLKNIRMNNDCFVIDTTDFSHIQWSISSTAIIVKGYQVRPNKAYTK